MRRVPAGFSIRRLAVRHAVMAEMPDIERIGEIVEIGQLVRNA